LLLKFSCSRNRTRLDTSHLVFVILSQLRFSFFHRLGAKPLWP
jgi:hypothetical protein